MLSKEDVAAIQRLHASGMGKKKIAGHLGISKNTVTRYLRQGGWRPYGGREAARSSVLDEHAEWLRQAFFTHGGNAVVLQQLLAERGVDIGVRTVQRAVAPLREQLERAEKATVRFETPPGWQMQADFGCRRASVGGRQRKIHLAVLTLCHSRRMIAYAFEHERRENWLGAFEGAFIHFGGVPREVLVDNARALVSSHDAATGRVVFNPVFADFCAFWGTEPRACRPRRPRTKGKVERGVGYTKSNGIAGRDFEDFVRLNRHLHDWSVGVADERVHGTTGERPSARFERAERDALLPLGGERAYPNLLVDSRRVHADACVQVDNNHYSVPCALIGRTVTVRMGREQVEVLHRGESVALHARVQGFGRWSVRPEHVRGMGRLAAPEPTASPPGAEGEGLSRGLEEYERVLEEVGR